MGESSQMQLKEIEIFANVECHGVFVSEKPSFFI